MNKIKRFLIGLLCAVSVSALALGFSACDDEKPSGEVPSIGGGFGGLGGGSYDDGDDNDDDNQGGGDTDDSDDNSQDSGSSDNGHVCVYDSITPIATKTCTQDGVELQVCSACGQGKYVTYKAEGHSLTTVAGQAATCTENGWTEYQKCQNSGCAYTENYQVLETDGHDWDNGTIMEATCVDGGYTLYSCTQCSETKTENPTQATGVHTYVNAICSVCDNEGLTFALSSDGTYYSVTGLADTNYTNIEIPATYKDKPVCTFGYAAFANSEIESIHIGANVTDLNGETFRNCTQLTTVTFDNPNAITEIKGATFDGCASLSNFTLGENVTEIGRLAFYGCTRIFNQSGNVYYLGQGYNDYAFALYPTSESVTSITIKAACKQVVEYAFYYCRNLQTVTFENNGICTKIGDGAFWDCPQLSNVVLPSGVEEVGEYAFEGCINLTSIHLGDSLKTLGEKALFDCGTLEISVPSTIERVGVLAFGERWNAQYETTFYEYNYKDDIGYIGNEDNPYVVAMKVEDLMESDSWLSYYKETAVFEDGCKIIYDGAAKDCQSLYTVRIPASVTYVGKNVFASEMRSDTTRTFYVESEEQLKNWHERWVVSDNATLVVEKFIGHLLYEEYDEYCTIVGFWGEPIEINIPEKIKGKVVRWIESEALYNCTSVKKIVVPETISYIDKGAFKGCSSLESITLPFVGSSRTSHEAATVENSVFGWIFGYIESDSSSPISGAIYQVSENTWGNTYKRYYYYIPSSLNTVVIGDSVETIGERAFYNCTNLKNITIGNSVTTIGERAFYNCANLKSVYYTGDIADWCAIDFDDNPLSDGADLYINNNEKVIDLVIPDGIETINSCAFSGCTSLTSVTIGNSVTTIGGSAFYNCTSLTSVYYTGGIEDWCAIVFVDYSSNPLSNGADLYIDNEMVVDLVIPDGIEMIKDYAFDGCTSVTNVTIPKFVTTIGSGAFSNCDNITNASVPTWAISCISKTNLKELVINAGDSIGGFYDCNNLISVTIGLSIEYIAMNAFVECNNLIELIFEDPNGWVAETFYVYDEIIIVTEELNPVDLADKEKAAQMLIDDYTAWELYKKK